MPRMSTELIGSSTRAAMCQADAASGIEGAGGNVLYHRLELFVVAPGYWEGLDTKLQRSRRRAQRQVVEPPVDELTQPAADLLLVHHATQQRAHLGTRALQGQLEVGRRRIERGEEWEGPLRGQVAERLTHERARGVSSRCCMHV